MRALRLRRWMLIGLKHSVCFDKYKINVNVFVFYLKQTIQLHLFCWQTGWIFFGLLDKQALTNIKNPQKIFKCPFLGRMEGVKKNTQTSLRESASHHHSFMHQSNLQSIVLFKGVPKVPYVYTFNCLGQNMEKGKWGSPNWFLTSKTLSTYKGASNKTFGCAKKGFQVPKIAPWIVVQNFDQKRNSSGFCL